MNPACLMMSQSSEDTGEMWSWWFPPTASEMKERESLGQTEGARDERGEQKKTFRDEEDRQCVHCLHGLVNILMKPPLAKSHRGSSLTHTLINNVDSMDQLTVDLQLQPAEHLLHHPALRCAGVSQKESGVSQKITLTQ